MKGRETRRSILHLDLDPFFVSVERSLDPSLRGQALIVGGGREGASGLVAAASAEARTLGVRAGQPLSRARQLCPAAVFRPGDLETYARVSQQVTEVLLQASRRVERPSSDEAFVDLSAGAVRGRAAVPVAEGIKNELQQRLGLDAALGLASSRLAARVASRWARPRGLLVVLPGYEQALVAKESLDVLEELPAHMAAALRKAGLETIGQLAEASLETLTSLVGAAAARRLAADARGEREEPIAVSAPPAWVQEEATLRERTSDREVLDTVLDGLAARAVRKLRPFDLAAGLLTVEVRRGGSAARRSQEIEGGVQDEDTTAELARALAQPLLEPPAGVRTVQLRLSRLQHPGPQAPLFPGRVRLIG